MADRQDVTRKLAAILYADVAGYSRLTGADEEGTHRIVADYLDAISELVSRSGGRVVHYAGDAVLADFPSVVTAVKSAIEIQKELAARNTEIPEDRKVQFRIGVNLGDVIVDRDDIYGNGVNVAARLESLAEAGGICISRKVLDEVEGKIDVGFDDIGPQEVKNIAKPVRAYRVLLATPSAKVQPAPLPEKPSIAVLPFTNLSGDPEQDFFGDGLAEDIITELSRFRSLLVIARNSTFTYKGRAVDVKAVAGDLGVRYVLEGSVRKSGQRIRVSAQLIDADTGSHIWAERYDRELDDLFVIQDEITNAIVAAIGPEIDSAERGRALRRSTERLDAWSAYQRGLWHVYRFTQADMDAASGFLIRATSLDPTFALAYAGLSLVQYSRAFLGYAKDRDNAIGEAYAFAKKSVVLDDRDAMAHWALGRVYKLRGEYHAAIEEFETAIALNPNFAQAYYMMGWSLALAGEPARAIPHIDKASRLSPRDPLLFAFMIVRAHVYLQLGEDNIAMQWAERAARQPNAHAHTKAIYAATLQRCNRHEAAARVVDGIKDQWPEYSCRLFEQSFSFKRSQDMDMLIDAMRAAGLPE